MPSLVKLCPGWVCGGFLDDSPGEWLLYFDFTSISPLQYDYLSKGTADTHNLLLYEKLQIQEFAKGSLKDD